MCAPAARQCFPVWVNNVIGSEQEAQAAKAASSEIENTAEEGRPSSAVPSGEHFAVSRPDRYGFKDRALVFFGIAFVWVLYDRLTKLYFENSYALGQVSPLDYLVVRFRLVHNTGMAWGLFGDSTFMLGIISLLVCAAIIALFLMYEKVFLRPPTLVESAALGLVLAGGVGNAIDRFLQGYVIDFLEFTFIDFPVFNIADIGVTCGFALILICMFMPKRQSGGGVKAHNPVECNPEESGGSRG